MKILLAGNGVDEFEKTLREALAPHDVVHLSFNQNGDGYRHGMKVDLDGHIPHVDVAIFLPHYQGHEAHAEKFKRHGIPTLSHSYDFHHLFADRDDMRNLVEGHGFKSPLHHRLHRDEQSPETLHGLSGILHLPVRVTPYGKEVTHEYYANTFPALHKAITLTLEDAVAVDMTKDIAGDKYSFFALPDFRNQEVYVTLPGVHSGTGFVIAKNMDKGFRSRAEAIVRDLYRLHTGAKVVRVDMVSDYVTSTRVISPLKAQPTFLEALKFAGVSVREYYQHLLLRVVEGR